MSKAKRRTATQPKPPIKYFRKASLVESDMGDTLLLFETATEQVHALSLSAKVIWNSLSSGPKSVGDIANFAGRVFAGTNPTQITTDVDDFLKVLGKKGLIGKGAIYGTVGREYYFEERAVPSYVPPQIQSYTRDWLKSNHPASFYNVMFSDTWNPSEPL
jgi:hypothetical protein